MQIDLWTDIICPWCGLGHHRLKLALERFPHRDAVTVAYHSFQLNEAAPMGETTPVRQMLERKLGMSLAQIEATTGQIEKLAAAEGLRPYKVADNVVGNTSMAHELAMWGTSAEGGKNDKIWDRLYTAYFAEGTSIFDIDSLVTLGGSVGLDPDQAREVLTSRRYQKAVYKDGVAASALGATGVPFYVVDNKYGIAGAQPVEVILRTIERAWAERDPAPTP